MKKLLTIISISVTLCSCSPKTGTVLYTPAQNDATASVSYEQLVAGRKIYVEKCGSCHNLKLPQTLTEPEWKTAVDKMQARSKITDEEKQTILDFLLVKAKNPS